MIFKVRPMDFKPSFDLAGCFVQHKGEFLLLKRQDHKPQGNTYSVPGGKVEDREGLRDAMLRELKEETGIKLTRDQLSYFDKVYVRFEEFDFIYHMFHIEVKDKNSIKINPEEHKEFVWTTPKQALNLPLIQDEDACIKLFYNL